MRRSTAVILCAALGWKVLQVAAQGNITYPACTVDSLSWSFNKESQSPCEVGAILQGLCFGNQWHIKPLSSDSQYSGPELGYSNACQCNTVAYSLIAACSVCQGGAGIPSWNTWKLNCSNSDVTVAGYPLQIPSYTSVPAWAYLNVTGSGDTWDEAAAQSLASSGAPETTGGTPPATAVSKPSATSSNSHSMHSNAGPIAGGVIGGLLALAILGLGCFVWYNKRRRAAQHGPEMVDVFEVGKPVQPSPADQFYGHVRSPSDDPPKLYDPSDPSTFPPSVLPSYAPPLQSPTGSGITHTTGITAQLDYKGVPEI